MWCDGGDRVWLRAPLCFPHGFSYRPGHSVRPRKPRQNNPDQWCKGLWYLFRGFLRRLSKYSIGKFIFKPRSKTKPLTVMSASLSKVSLSCFQGTSERIPETRDLDRASAGVAWHQGQSETFPYVSEGLNQTEFREGPLPWRVRCCVHCSDPARAQGPQPPATRSPAGCWPLTDSLP